MKYSRLYSRVGTALCLSVALVGLLLIILIPNYFSHTSAHSHLINLRTETVEETVTLSPARITSSKASHTWADCKGGTEFIVGRGPDDVPGTMNVGYELWYNKGTAIIGCDQGGAWVDQGVMWFDLSEIASKAPPLHVFIETAKLKFKQDNECESRSLLIAQADWSKGYDGFVPGDEFSEIPKICPSCGLLDVAKVLNNWLRGEGNGGYANYGFIVRANEEKWVDQYLGSTHARYSRACWTRYYDVTLTVTYKYDKQSTPTILVAPGVIGGGRTNVALAAKGAVASASSTTPGYAASGVINGDEKGLNFGKDGYWSSADASLPAWLEINFGSDKTIGEIDVFTIQDDFTSPIQPTATTPFSKYGIRDFEVQYWNGSGWMTVTGGNVTGNNLVWRKFTFAAITTGRIRILTHGSPDGYSRLAEVEAWAK